MSKYEVKNSIWFVLIEGIRIYFSNIDKFFVYMLFPVFGQILGIMLAFGLSLGFSERVVAAADSVPKALFLVVLLALPGLLIFTKAFWDFMVAYVALNSMTEGAICTGRVYDFQSHNEVATRRTFKYIALLMAVCVLSTLASNIFLMVPGFVLWIFFILVYQVFTFEDDLSVSDCFKRSFNLILGDWLRTVILLVFLWFFSIFIISTGVTVIFDYLNLTDKICVIFNFITNAVPLDLCNRVLVHFGYPIITPDMISKWIFYSVISVVVTGLTLPLRSICWTLWYFNLAQLKSSKVTVKKRRKSSVKSDDDFEG